MTTLEEITYEAGRAALADQESLVAGVRQRTGTLLAAQALVASFLGGAAIKGHRLDGWGWSAVAMLVLGLAIAAIVLAPWRLRFAVDATDLYELLYEQAAAESADETLGWLASVGYTYQAIRVENSKRVRWMSSLSGALGVVMILQTVLWLLALRLH